MTNRIKTDVKCSGESLSEYGLIGVLVVLVAIPVAMMIGQNSLVPMQQINVNTNTELNNLTSLLSTQTAPGGQPGATTGPGSTAARPQGQVTIGDDTLSFTLDEGGKLVFSENTGNGNTTSIDGFTVTSKVADRLDEIVREAQANGNLPPETINRLSQIANIARAMGYNQSDVSQLVGPGNSSGGDNQVVGGGGPAGLDSDSNVSKELAASELTQIFNKLFGGTENNNIPSKNDVDPDTTTTSRPTLSTLPWSQQSQAQLNNSLAAILAQDPQIMNTVPELRTLLPILPTISLNNYLSSPQIVALLASSQMPQPAPQTLSVSPQLLMSSIVPNIQSQIAALNLSFRRWK